MNRAKQRCEPEETTAKEKQKDQTLEAVKQRLTAVPILLKKYSREVEFRKNMFSNNSANVSTQQQDSKTKTDPPKADTEPYWNIILARQASHNANGNTKAARNIL